MTKTQRINYKTAQDLEAVFKAGAKFVIVRPFGPQHEVTKIEAKEGDKFHVHVNPVGAVWYGFNLDGTHRANSCELHQLPEAVPAKRPGVDILAALAAGETLYCPKTREVVDGVVHHPVEGFLVFLWKTDSDGRRVQGDDLPKLLRASENYRVDGTHRHDPARDLVKGPVPKLKKLYVTVVGRNDRFGTIGSVTYAAQGPNGTPPMPAVGTPVKHGELYAAIGSMPGTVIHVCTFEA